MAKAKGGRQVPGPTPEEVRLTAEAWCSGMFKSYEEAQDGVRQMMERKRIEALKRLAAKDSQPGLFKEPEPWDSPTDKKRVT